MSSVRLALALVALAVVAGVFWGSRAPEPPPDTVAFGQSEVSVSRQITVHVSGWVVSPGLVELREGARVADAVAAAGGLRPGADTSSINLAASVSDGEQIVIGQIVIGAAGSQGTDGDPSMAGKVHINRASAQELEALSGVGPVLAQRILDYRQENGPFEAVEDLLDVPGIGEAKLAALRDQVVLP